MASKREAALDALLAALRAVAGPDSRRGGELPTRPPAGGLLILRDGIPGDPEVTMSPLVYEYRHRAEIEIIVQPVAGADPDDVLDDLIVRVGAAIDADRTLGGVVLWAEPGAPETEDLALEGIAGIRGAVVPVELNYITTGPLA